MSVKETQNPSASGTRWTAHHRQAPDAGATEPPVTPEVSSSTLRHSNSPARTWISRHLNRGWRALGTLFSFTLFGCGGLVIGLLAAPMLNVLYREPRKRQHTARRLIAFSFRGFLMLMRGLGVLEYRLSHVSRLKRPGQLILANHPSLIDVIFLLAYTPNADCVVKGKLATNPFTRGPVRAAGYITNQDPQDVLEAAGHSLAQGHSLILFPEGTRTTPQRPIKFRRGGANIALRIGTPITPVLILCAPPTLSKEHPWYHVPARKVEIELHVLDDIPLPTDKQQPMAQTARRLTHQLSDYFNQELEQRRHERNPRPVA
ncbi:lysophospholipid acyltransferase family protein [Chromohalobacter beijerinckii]